MESGGLQDWPSNVKAAPRRAWAFEGLGKVSSWAREK